MRVPESGEPDIVWSANPRKAARRRRLARWLPPLLTGAIRALYATLRIRVEVSPAARRWFRSGRPFVLGFWHGRILILSQLYRDQFPPPDDLWALISQHWDGELIARTVRPFGVRSIRGSSTRGGRDAFREMCEHIGRGHRVGITPDGPKGPRFRVVQRGIVRLARETGVPVVPMSWSAWPRFRMHSWDRFLIPLPFARVVALFGDPLLLDPAEDVEAQRLRVEARMNALTHESHARARAGRRGAGGRMCGTGRRRTVRTGRARWWACWSRGWTMRDRLTNAMQAHWESEAAGGLRGAALSCLLWPPAWIYGAVQRCRRRLYRWGILRSRKLFPAVVSVGGLRVGGSGKTPFTCWLARGLRERGYRVAVLTRGYGRTTSGEPLILGGEGAEGPCDPDRFGDEPCLLAASLGDVPVGVDACRHRGALYLLRAFAVDVFVLDDGFQHRALARDCDIVLLPDGDEPARMHCLPRGPLREPASALRDADLVVRVREGTAGAAARAGTGEKGTRRPGPGNAWEARMLPGDLRSLDAGEVVEPGPLRGTGVLAFCGIARPGSFWRSLEGMGLRVEASRAFPDHHRYTEADHRELLALMGRHPRAVTTAKDAVKLARYAWPPGKLLVLDLRPVVRREAAFWRFVEARIRGAGDRGGVPGRAAGGVGSSGKSRKR